MKTKILLLSILASTLTYNLYAQTNSYGLAVVVNSIQGQIEIPLMTGTGALIVDADGNIVILGGDRTDNSYSFSIVPKYFINKDVLLRFEFGITNLNLKANAEQKISTHNITNAEVTNKILRYAPGFQWFFMREKRIESYFGMTASYINYQSLYYNLDFVHKDLVTDTVVYRGSIKESTPGGFAVGVGAFAGFNIYLHKKISLGAELSSSALYYKLGGETLSATTGQSLPNPSTTETNTYTNSYKGFRISKIISSFNITFWL